MRHIILIPDKVDFREYILETTGPLNNNSKINNYRRHSNPKCVYTKT